MADHEQLPELTQEITNSEKFFKYFQHMLTGEYHPPPENSTYLRLISRM